MSLLSLESDSCSGLAVHHLNIVFPVDTLASFILWELHTVILWTEGMTDSSKSHVATKQPDWEWERTFLGEFDDVEYGWVTCCFECYHSSLVFHRKLIFSLLCAGLLSLCLWMVQNLKGSSKSSYLKDWQQKQTFIVVYFFNSLSFQPQALDKSIFNCNLIVFNPNSKCATQQEHEKSIQRWKWF